MGEGGPHYFFRVRPFQTLGELEESLASFTTPHTEALTLINSRQVTKSTCTRMRDFKVLNLHHPQHIVPDRRRG